ncbi:MAG: hypothetical protein AAGF23_13045 [Acidobacteriota bacterium]
MRRLLYSSPVDVRNLEEWGGLADDLRRAVIASCGKGVAVEVGDRAIFRRGGDFEETLAGLEELRLGRAVRVDLWSSVAGYGVIAFTLGFDIKRAERRALEKKLRKVLRGESPLRDLEGVYTEETGLAFGFALSAADDAAARADLEHLLFAFEEPLYLGERWLLQDGEERLDESSFEHIAEPAPGLVTFFAADGDAAERIWRHCGSGDGLIALFPDDPALPDLVRGFREGQDLRLLTSRHPYSGLRVTIDRRPGDEPLVVAYTATGPPEIEELPLFIV